MEELFKFTKFVQRITKSRSQRQVDEKNLGEMLGRMQVEREEKGLEEVAES